MKLHLIYRIYGGENMKGRPDYYSKRVCLASFLRAAENASADLVILADGPIPEDLRTMIADRGTVVQIPGGPVGMRRSFIAGLKLPAMLGWPDEDLVYFAEDDYLHDPDSFLRLTAAGDAIPSAGYFALYAGVHSHPVSSPDVPVEDPHDWIQRPGVLVAGQRWVNVPSTASTFGARIGTLRSDLGIFLQSMLPYRTRYLDHQMCLVYQGRYPYRVSELFLGPAETRFRSGPKEFVANLWQTPFRIAYQLRSLTRRRHPHLLYAASPNLACHMETEFMSPGTDWEALAAQTLVWADSIGSTVDQGN